MAHEAPVFTANTTGFPVLELKNVEQMREEHRLLLKKLFPSAVRLNRLIFAVERNFATEIASIIGSVDFAKERLAGLLAALKELELQVAAPSKIALSELREQIRLDHRIHESLEELVFDCVKFQIEDEIN